jgi:hypothetical protein
LVMELDWTPGTRFAVAPTEAGVLLTAKAT